MDKEIFGLIHLFHLPSKTMCNNNEWKKILITCLLERFFLYKSLNKRLEILISNFSGFWFNPFITLFCSLTFLFFDAQVHPE